MKARHPNYGKLAGVDLARPTADIMAETGCCMQAIIRARRKAGLPSRQYRNPLHGVDLTRPADVLAREHGVSMKAVWAARRRAGISATDCAPCMRHPKPPRAPAPPKASSKSKPLAQRPEPPPPKVVAANDIDATILEELYAGEVPCLLAFRLRVPVERVEDLARRIGRA